MSTRGEYGATRSNKMTFGTVIALMIVAGGVFLAPVVAIVGGTALATAMSSRRPQRPTPRSKDLS